MAARMAGGVPCQLPQRQRTVVGHPRPLRGAAAACTQRGREREGTAARGGERAEAEAPFRVQDLPAAGPCRAAPLPAPAGLQGVLRAGAGRAAAVPQAVLRDLPSPGRGGLSRAHRGVLILARGAVPRPLLRRHPDLVGARARSLRLGTLRPARLAAHHAPPPRPPLPPPPGGWGRGPLTRPVLKSEKKSKAAFPEMLFYVLGVI